MTRFASAAAMMYEIVRHVPIFHLLHEKVNSVHSRTASVVKRVIKKSNIEKLQTELKLINWNDLTKSDDPEESFNTFDEVFMKLYNSCIPEKGMRQKNEK